MVVINIYNLLVVIEALDFLSLSRFLQHAAKTDYTQVYGTHIKALLPVDLNNRIIDPSLFQIYVC